MPPSPSRALRGCEDLSSPDGAGTPVRGAASAGPSGPGATSASRIGRPAGRRGGLATVGLGLILAVAACTSDPVRRPPPGPDAGDGDLLEPPDLEPLPLLTPLDSLAIRGDTAGNRVVGIGLGGAVITPVLPGGTFCQQQPVAEAGETTIQLYAVSGDGRVSLPLEVSVVRDPEAPAPSTPPCSGSEVGMCEDAEVCGDDGDDEDCDGWADDCDASCSGCEDDAYEPNDVAVNVPTLLAGTYPLTICPCRDDWFAFTVAPGGRVRATARFTHSLIDLDVRLYQVNPDGSGTGMQVAFSGTTADVETIDYLSASGGTYYLRIYPFRTALKPRGTYSLTVPP